MYEDTANKPYVLHGEPFTEYCEVDPLLLLRQLSNFERGKCTPIASNKRDTLEEISCTSVVPIWQCSTSAVLRVACGSCPFPVVLAHDNPYNR